MRTVLILLSLSAAMPARAQYSPSSGDGAVCTGRPRGTTAARSTGNEITSIGVSYFAGRSRGGDDAHLATALTNEIASQLLSVRVTATKPGRAAPARLLLTVKLSDGGEPTDVDLSMTGSVFRDDTLLRTSVKVTRTSDGSVIWTGTRSRPILDLPILARLIAQDVVVRIGAELATPAPHAAAEKSAELFELILRGMYVRSRYSPDALVAAIRYLDQAAVLDPASERVRDLRQTAQLRLLAWGGKGGSSESSLAPRAMLHRVLERSRDESERLLDEADEELRDGQDTHACTLLNAAIENDARTSPAYALRALVRARGGMVREAFADAETVTQLGRPLWGDAVRAVILRRAGDEGGARREIARLVASTRARAGALPFWDARFLAISLAQLGDVVGAQAMLKRIDAQDPRLAWTRNDPMLVPPPRSVRSLRRR